MKQINKFLVLINILFIGFLLGILISFNVNAISDSDIVFTFENDVLFNQDDSDFYKSINVRQNDSYGNTYIFPASYSFDGEVSKTGLQISFVDNIISGTPEYIQVVNFIDDHKDVLFINETSGTTEFLHNCSYTTGVLYGVDEFWVRMVETDNKWVYNLENNTGHDLGLWKIDGGKFQEHFIGIWEDVGVAALDNTWYYIQFSWEYTDGGFNGLTQGQCNLRINQVDHKYGIVDDDKYINRLTMKVSTPGEVYIDGYGEYREPYYTGIYYDVSEAGSQWGLTYDGEYFWATSAATYRLYKYYSNGTYTGFYFSTGSEDIVPRGSTWDGEYLWVVGDTNQYVYAYYLNGTYTGTSFDVGVQESDPYDVFWDGQYFWVIGFNYDNVFQYTVEGVYTGYNFETHDQDNNPYGIIKLGNYFWVLGGVNDKIYKYTLEGDYTGVFIYVGGEDIWPRGLTVNGTDIWVIGDSTSNIYKYSIATDYVIGNNYNPLWAAVEGNAWEPDKWEFTYKGLFERLEDGDDNPNGWTDLEDGGDDVNCLFIDYIKGVVELEADPLDQIGLYKDNLGYSQDIAINVSFGFEMKYVYFESGNSVYMKVYSSDNTEIIRILITYNGVLYRWTGSDYILLATGFVINTDYDINVFVNYYTDKCILKYSVNGTVTNNYEFPLTSSGKTGLKKVAFEVSASSDIIRVYLDYIGIYINGQSITTEYGSIGLHVSDHSYWYFEEHNLLSVNIIGEEIAIYLYIANYCSVISPGFEPEEIVLPNSYNGLTFFNLYDYLYDDYWGKDYIWGGVLWFLFNNTFKFIETNIEGVKLTDGINDYPLEFDYSGINVIDNYFYVLDNKLYFSQTSDDNDLEYIQATFNIENLGSQNRSVSYNSILNGNSYGYFSIKYHDTTLTPLPLRTYVAAPNVILPQDKEISGFVILITDKDIDTIQGTTTGYITDIKLVYIIDVSLSIIISALFEILIPLLVLIIPTFLFYLRLGKGAIVPTFMLMAFICFITNLIPLWVFFVILISSGAFLVLDKTILKEVNE